MGEAYSQHGFKFDRQELDKAIAFREEWCGVIGKNAGAVEKRQRLPRISRAVSQALKVPDFIEFSEHEKQIYKVKNQVNEVHYLKICKAEGQVQHDKAQDFQSFVSKTLQLPLEVKLGEYKLWNCHSNLE